jgi:hypothetical protein
MSKSQYTALSSVVCLGILIAACHLIPPIPNPFPTPRPGITQSPSPTQASPTPTATEPSPSPTQLRSTATSTTTPTPTGSPRPPKLDRWTNGPHGGFFNYQKHADGKWYFNADSTRKYRSEGRLHVCDRDHFLDLEKYCSGRDWDSKLHALWSPVGGNNRIIPNDTYYERPDGLYQQGYNAAAEAVLGDFFIKTCPQNPDLTPDGILVPHTQTGGCYTAKYNCSTLSPKPVCKKVQ